MNDLISRQAAIKAADSIIERDTSGNNDVVKAMTAWKEYIKALPSAQPDERMLHESCTDCPLYDKDRHSCPRFNKVIPVTFRELQFAQPEQRWIPCSEQLPEEDTEVLISYRHKEGEGDTSHTYIDITTYGQMYFGGNKVGNHKHWRAPFEYFESNYEVIAWMPLPEPWEGEGNERA